MFTKDTAPNFAVVQMDYTASPIWISFEGSEQSHCDVNDFPFPSSVKHLLKCYENAWARAHSLDFMTMEELNAELNSGSTMAKAIAASLTTLGRACEQMMADWFSDNGWRTIVKEQKNFL